MFILNPAINSLSVNDNRKLKTGGKMLLSKTLIVLIIDFKKLGHGEKRNSFQSTPFLKASFFDTFKLRHAIIRR